MSTVSSARKPWQHDKRTRQERGYGAEWDKLRLEILKRDRYLCKCAACTKAKRLRPATQADHIVSKANWQKLHGSLEGVDHPSNLQAINKDCHEAKNLLDKGIRPKTRIGPDGWPIEPA